jgi:hypothetical protein
VTAFTFAAPIPPSPPSVTSVSASGTNLVVVSAGATNGTIILLTSSDLSVPVTNWTRVVTNAVDASGLFTNTIPILPGQSQRFYLPVISQ